MQKKFTRMGVLMFLLVLAKTYAAGEQEFLREIFPPPEKSGEEQTKWPPKNLPPNFKKESEEQAQEKKRRQELLQQCLTSFQYPVGRTYATFSTVSHDKKIASYKLLLWTNAKQTSLFSVLHPQNGLQERIKFFAGKEYMHIFWISRQKLLTRNIVSDLRSRFEIAVENSPLYFSDLHPTFLIQQYDVIVDEFDDVFSQLDMVKGKTLPHARRYLFEQIRQNPLAKEYQTVTLQSKIAALHDVYALNQKPFESWRKEEPPRAYYGYLTAYIKDKKIYELEHFDSNGYFLKSVKFSYGTLPIKNEKHTQGKEQSIADFPMHWEIVEPSQKRITRVEFFNHSTKELQDYYFSDDYFTRP